MNKRRATVLLLLVMALAWPVIALFSRAPVDARAQGTDGGGGSIQGHNLFDMGELSDIGSGRYNAVSVGDHSGGRASTNVSAAIRGRRVTVSATPDPDHLLERIAIVDADGQEVRITMLDATRCSFIMPAKGVEVRVSFVRLDGQEDPAAPGGAPEPSQAPGSEEPAQHSPAPTRGGGGFTDVSAGAYYYAPIKWAVGKGITTGTGPEAFSPEASCTRAQMVTFLWRAAGSPLVSGRTLFKDVSPVDYYFQAVLWAVEQGITTGTGADTFGPEETVSRAQTVTFLHRCAGSPQTGPDSPFRDVSSADYYASAVRWAAERGIITGTGGGLFSPLDACTRGQAMTLLWRYMV